MSYSTVIFAYHSQRIFYEAVFRGACGYGDALTMKQLSFGSLCSFLKDIGVLYDRSDLNEVELLQEQPGRRPLLIAACTLSAATVAILFDQALAALHTRLPSLSERRLIESVVDAATSADSSIEYASPLIPVMQTLLSPLAFVSILIRIAVALRPSRDDLQADLGCSFATAAEALGIFSRSRIVPYAAALYAPSPFSQLAAGVGVSVLQDVVSIYRELLERLFCSYAAAREACPMSPTEDEQMGCVLPCGGAWHSIACAPLCSVLSLEIPFTAWHTVGRVASDGPLVMSPRAFVRLIHDAKGTTRGGALGTEAADVVGAMERHVTTTKRSGFGLSFAEFIRVVADLAWRVEQRATDVVDGEGSDDEYHHSQLKYNSKNSIASDDSENGVLRSEKATKSLDSSYRNPNDTFRYDAAEGLSPSVASAISAAVHSQDVTAYCAVVTPTAKEHTVALSVKGASGSEAQTSGQLLCDAIPTWGVHSGPWLKNRYLPRNKLLSPPRPAVLNLRPPRTVAAALAAFLENRLLPSVPDAIRAGAPRSLDEDRDSSMLLANGKPSVVQSFSLADSSLTSSSRHEELTADCSVARGVHGDLLQPRVVAVSPSAGPARGGVRLTIRGRSFGVGLQVAVGGVVCPLAGRVEADAASIILPAITYDAIAAGKSDSSSEWLSSLTCCGWTWWRFCLDAMATIMRRNSSI